MRTALSFILGHEILPAFGTYGTASRGRESEAVLAEIGQTRLMGDALITSLSLWNQFEIRSATQHLCGRGIMDQVSSVISY